MNLPRTVKTALNKRAHAEGLRHAEAVKSRLMADLLRLRGEGATVAELIAHIEKTS